MIQFTEKELELIKYLTEGFGNQQIASKMFLSTSAIKSHMTVIMNKLGVKNRTCVAIIAVVIGIVDYREIKFLKPFLNDGDNLNVSGIFEKHL